jgi:hypothetical protein
MIMPPPLFRERRVEAFAIEIAQVHLMAGAPETRQRRIADRGVEAFGQRVALELKDAHEARPHAFGTKVRILPGLSRP